MNPRTLTRPQLVNFARNAATAMAAGKVTGFTPQQSADLAAELAAEAEALQMEDDKIVDLLARYHEQIERAGLRRLKILKMLTQDKFAMRSVGATGDQYVALGFDPPADTRARTKPKTPTKLAVTGLSNGVNKLKFKGNNVSGRVSYMIEANSGDGWVMIDSTPRQSYVHSGVKPGQRYEYRVRSKTSRGQFSAWSNKAAVYETEAQ